MGRFCPKMALSQNKPVDIQQVPFYIGRANRFVSMLKQFVSHVKQLVLTLQTMSDNALRNLPPLANTGVFEQLHKAARLFQINLVISKVISYLCTRNYRHSCSCVDLYSLG